MSLAGKGVTEGSMAAVQIVAAGTPWERRFDLGVVARELPRWAFGRRLAWRLGAGARRRQRAAIEAEIAAYRKQIAKEGCTPEYMSRVAAERQQTR